MSVGRRNAVSIVLLAFVAATVAVLGVNEFRHARAVRAAGSSQGAASPDRGRERDRTILVSYFHTATRCTSCLLIEDYTSTTVRSAFPGQLADGKVKWRVVNTDEPANAHFVKDYGLYTKTVIVSEIRDGKEVRWKNLDQVWHLLDDAPGFQAYVEKEVRSFLEPA